MRTGFGAGSQGITIYDAATAARQGDLPPGVAAPDWSALYAVDDQDGTTTVKVVDPALGPDAPAIRQRLIPGDYVPVPSGLDGASSGLSPNGKWLVLAGRTAAPEQNQGTFGRNSGASDRFVVVDTAFNGYAHGVILPRPYRFYAISDDGALLYLLENASQDQGRFRWQIRVYDVKKSQLIEKPLADQDGQVVVTQGTGGTASPAGDWLFSVDATASGGLVLNALNFSKQAVQRVDLPSVAAGSSPFQARFSLIPSPDGQSLYLVSGTPAVAVAIDTSRFTVRASTTMPQASLPPATGTPGRAPSDTSAANRRFGLRNPVLSPDGRRLYVPQTGGLAVLNTSDLSSIDTYLFGISIDTVALTADGRRLYVASSERSTLYRLDAQTGEVLLHFDAPTQPLAFLHVSTNP